MSPGCLQTCQAGHFSGPTAHRCLRWKPQQDANWHLLGKPRVVVPNMEQVHIVYVLCMYLHVGSELLRSAIEFPNLTSRFLSPWSGKLPLISQTNPSHVVPWSVQACWRFAHLVALSSWKEAPYVEFLNPKKTETLSKQWLQRFNLQPFPI